MCGRVADSTIWRVVSVESLSTNSNSTPSPPGIRRSFIARKIALRLAARLRVQIMIETVFKAVARSSNHNAYAFRAYEIANSYALSIC